MSVIWKYAVYNDTTRIEMPRGAKILVFQTQSNLLFLWALVDPKEPLEVRLFEVYGTGHDIADEDVLFNRLTYLGTAQIDDGRYVFHAFERRST